MRVVLARLAGMLATLGVASMVIYLILAVLPGDPAAFLASRASTRASPETLALIREQLGLDQPLPLRYLHWLANALHGDFGRSWLTGASVMDLMGQRIGATALLGVFLFLSGCLLTFVLGGLAALKPRGVADRLLSAQALIGTALPGFVLGLIAIRIFANGLGWASVIGDGTPRTVLPPAAVGGLGLASYWGRPFSSLVGAALASDWALAARARGIGETRLLWRHAIPNALVGFLPFLGIGLAGALTGTIMIENVFSWPGLGAFIVDAIKRRDLPVVQAFAMLAVTFYIATTAAADLMFWLLSPRADQGGAQS
ncbi:peptide/nickel transport system permease protein [Rhizobium sp. SG_E_25_P2]|uniref:ABC transporter permease n=1 Tax=Rhizobium sp. SG_E_25_P2 TaxID=2879942 RepID=UPI0024764AB5|nr:ABC transporter permease [Rhizobium sp. SG_E_25_P2]MDH6269560.1 peptide/nickel transport system permease protein [Rhizobium sp. SG_E_25_P2]